MSDTPPSKTPTTKPPLPPYPTPNLSASPAATAAFIAERRGEARENKKSGYYCSDYMADVEPIDFTNPHDLRNWYQSQLHILGATNKYLLLECGFEHLPLAIKTQQLMQDMMKLLSDLPADDLERINAQKLVD